jgi:transposase
MPKSHRPYQPEFRQRIIELVRKGRTPEELARQFEPLAQAIRNWVRQDDRDAGRRQDGLTTMGQKSCAGCAARIGRSARSGRS